MKFSILALSVVIVMSTLSSRSFAESDFEVLIQAAPNLKVVKKNLQQWPYLRDLFDARPLSAALVGLLETKGGGQYDIAQGKSSNMTSYTYSRSVVFKNEELNSAPKEADLPFDPTSFKKNVFVIKRLEVYGEVPKPLYRVELSYTTIREAKRPSKVQPGDVVLNRYENVPEWMGNWVLVESVYKGQIEVEVTSIDSLARQ